jgi:hypothetical protein
MSGEIEPNSTCSKRLQEDIQSGKAIQEVRCGRQFLDENSYQQRHPPKLAIDAALLMLREKNDWI